MNISIVKLDNSTLVYSLDDVKDIEVCTEFIFQKKSVYKTEFQKVNGKTEITIDLSKVPIFNEVIDVNVIKKENSKESYLIENFIVIFKNYNERHIDSLKLTKNKELNFKLINLEKYKSLKVDCELLDEERNIIFSISKNLKGTKELNDSFDLNKALQKINSMKFFYRLKITLNEDTILFIPSGKGNSIEINNSEIISAANISCFI